METGAVAAVLAPDDTDDEYKRRRKEAGDDTEKLWSLVNWCEAQGLSSKRRTCLNDIVKLDPDDKKAHELLGHVEHDGEWFKSERALTAHLRKLEREQTKEAERMAKERGWVRYKDQWVDPADIPRLEKGWIRTEDGEWMDPEEYEKLQNGWIRQDLEWVAPDEIAKMNEGLWKCGNEWLALDAADTYHARLDRPWRIPGKAVLLYTTLDRTNAELAMRRCNEAYEDLTRIVGITPGSKPAVFVASSVEQYKELAGAVDWNGWSSVHGAFHALGWMEDGRFRGGGVCYWDPTTDAGVRFGNLWSRHATAHSFLEALDPSDEAYAAFTAKREEAGEEGGDRPPGADFDNDAFWEEKLLPMWLRYGAAAYVERYYEDELDDNPWWTRKWSIANIENRGGLDPLDKIWEFELSVDDPEGSGRLINEAGLIVAFVVDGGCAPVMKKHEAVKEAFLAAQGARDDPKVRKDLLKALEGLEKEIDKNSKDLRAFMQG